MMILGLTGTGNYPGSSWETTLVFGVFTLLFLPILNCGQPLKLRNNVSFEIKIISHGYIIIRT